MLGTEIERRGTKIERHGSERRRRPKPTLSPHLSEPRSWRPEVAPGERRLALRVKRNPGAKNQDPRRRAKDSPHRSIQPSRNRQCPQRCWRDWRPASVGLRLGGVDWVCESIARRLRCCAREPRVPLDSRSSSSLHPGLLPMAASRHWETEISASTCKTESIDGWGLIDRWVAP